MKKVAYVIGVIACLFAAEGLNRFGSIVRTFRDGDASIYMAMLVASFFCAVLFTLAWVKKLPIVLKCIGIVCLLGSIVLLLEAPDFPVIRQIFLSLVVALICLFCAEVSKKEAQP